MKTNHKSLLAISFDKGFRSPNIPIITCMQGNKKLNFIIDTGADDNVINSDVIDTIEHQKIEYDGTLTGLGGIYDVKACSIKLDINGETFTDKFLVSDHLKEAFNKMEDTHAIILHGLLGSNFLKRHNIVLDFNNFTAYNKNNG